MFSGDSSACVARPALPSDSGTHPEHFVQNKLKDEGTLIEEGKITDQEMIMDYHKKQATIKTLREGYAVREKHAKEVANEIKVKDDVEEAVAWLQRHKEKDWNEAVKKKERIEAGEKVGCPPAHSTPARECAAVAMHDTSSASLTACAPSPSPSGHSG